MLSPASACHAVAAGEKRMMPVSGSASSRVEITNPGYSSSVPDFDLDKLARFLRTLRI
jgi:hypothetical protein